MDAASRIGEKTGIPKLIVGAMIVSLATTLPEMIVSFFAAANFDAGCIYCLLITDIGGDRIVTGTKHVVVTN